jgi:alpha-L-fucosidase
VGVQEHIALGQRVRKFAVEAEVDGKWQEVAAGTTVGYKRILPLKGVKSDKLRVRFIDSRGPLTISRIAVY